MISKIADKLTPLFPRTLRNAERRARRFWIATRKRTLYILTDREKMDPICLYPFNDARECLFKGDGNIYNCKEWINLYVNCQKDPIDYKSFLESSSSQQKAAKKFDFTKHRGMYDRYMGWIKFIYLLKMLTNAWFGNTSHYPPPSRGSPNIFKFLFLYNY